MACIAHCGCFQRDLILQQRAQVRGVHISVCPHKTRMALSSFLLHIYPVCSSLHLFAKCLPDLFASQVAVCICFHIFS